MGAEAVFFHTLELGTPAYSMTIPPVYETRLDEVVCYFCDWISIHKQYIKIFGPIQLRMD